MKKRTVYPVETAGRLREGFFLASIVGIGAALSGWIYKLYSGEAEVQVRVG